MAKQCCVEFCKSVSFSGCGISFHRLPKDEEIKKKWLDVVPVSLQITNNSVVCSLHFNKEDFYDDMQQLLKANVIPSIFPLVKIEDDEYTTLNIESEDNNDKSEDPDSSDDEPPPKKPYYKDVSTQTAVKGNRQECSGRTVEQYSIRIKKLDEEILKHSNILLQVKEQLINIIKS